MSFKEILNDYINQIDCTSKELSEITGISETMISRYRSGKRIPSNNNEQINKIIDGIYKLCIRKDINLTKEDIINSFKNLNSNKIDNDLLIKNLNELINLFNISVVDMARYLNFDASYLSRIRNGKRYPADPDGFANSICNYIINRYNTETNLKTIANLINDDTTDKEIIINKLNSWICSNSKEAPNYVNDFLKKFDEFNLNEYIRTIHFDELKVPSFPFRLPTNKNYYGLEEIKNGELDFFKATVLSKSMEPIFMCSDMPMEDMAKDLEFGKKWMFAIAMSLKKGLNINIIHNIDRPFNEMMLGLQGWIPIYMTGQVSPYYLKGELNNIYCHLNYVSGVVALEGECLKGLHDKSKYYLTNNKDELNYYHQKAASLLKKAQPLIQIFKKENESLYNAHISSEMNIKGRRHGILSTLPLYTIKRNNLIEILKRNSISEKDKKKILNYYDNLLKKTNELLSHSEITDEILEPNKKEFQEHPFSLSLSGMFYDKKIYYTYQEYNEHYKQTKEFVKKNDNYSIIINNNMAFRNIQIFIRDSKWVMISKDDNPTIHFIIHHPKLCNAIEKFATPVIEKEQ